MIRAIKFLLFSAVVYPFQSDPNATVIRTIFSNISEITNEYSSKEVSTAIAKWWEGRVYIRM